MQQMQSNIKINNIYNTANTERYIHTGITDTKHQITTGILDTK
jgi:hypothetical protein